MSRYIGQQLMIPYTGEVMSRGPKEYIRDRSFLRRRKLEFHSSSKYKVFSAFPAGDHKRQAVKTSSQDKQSRQAVKTSSQDKQSRQAVKTSSQDKQSRQAVKTSSQDKQSRQAVKTNSQDKHQKQDALGHHTPI